VRSPLLGLELAVVDDWLRVLDPETGEPVPNADEEHLALLTARARIDQAEARAAAAERAMQAALAELARLRAEQG